MSATITQLATRAVRAYEAQFVARPEAAGYAPGRVNLIGEHTDYNGGLALPVALQLGCVVAVGPAPEPHITAVAADLDDCVRFPADTQAAGPVLSQTPSWAGYAPAAAMEALFRLGHEPGPPGLHLAISSDVPMGGGLSSSAALEVAAATAVETLLGTRMDPREKAQLCQSVEHEWAGCPCGLLDQLTATCARADHALLIDFAAMAIEHFPVHSDGVFLLFPSGVQHDNASGDYDSVRAVCKQAADVLELEHLSLATSRMIRNCARLSDAQRRAARHVVTENNRVRQMVSALSGRDWGLAGDLLRAGYLSLSNELQVSCPAVDELVKALEAVPGVYGARMTGGGFGGYVLALADAARADAVAGAFQDNGNVIRVVPSACCRGVAVPDGGFRAS